jgi:tRNA nucleotidyltransferase/poly(A) polymerase
LIRTVAQEALAARREVLVVGGYIRDVLTLRKTNDADFVVDRDTPAFARRVAARVRGRIIKLDELNGIYRVVVKRGGEFYNLDFSRLRGKNMLADLSRRDFTVNAAAVRAADALSFTASRDTGLLIDPFGAARDINHGIIRSIRESNFVEDPLRLIRAFRFKAQLGFCIEKRTLAQIRKHARLIVRPAKERVRDELIKIFSSGRSPEIVEEMDACGLLASIFPEIAAMKKSARKFYYHPKGLFQHALETLGRANEIIVHPGMFFPEVKEQFAAYVAGREWLIRFVSLMHDLAKPYTVKRIKGKVRFFGHEELGGKNISKIMERMRFSMKERRFAKHLVENHMRPGNLSQAGVTAGAAMAGAMPTPKAKYRFFRDLGDESADILALALADRLSYIRISKKPREITGFREFARKMVRDFFIHKKRTSRPRLVDGHMLMDYLGLEPGPAVGELLRIIEQAHHLGRVNTAEAALALAKKRVKAVMKKTAAGNRARQALLEILGKQSLCTKSIRKVRFPARKAGQVASKT